MRKKKSGFLKEFKEFAMKGNMLDLAVQEFSARSQSTSRAISMVAIFRTAPPDIT